MKVPIADIKIGPRFRKDLGKIPDLEESIKEPGQLVPIVIDPNPSPPPKYMVVDGVIGMSAENKEPDISNDEITPNVRTDLSLFIINLVI